MCCWCLLRNKARRIDLWLIGEGHGLCGLFPNLCSCLHFSRGAASSLVCSGGGRSVVALTLIYWCIALPERVGIATGLVVGVGLDVLEGAALGQNAFALMVVALLALTLYQRLRVSRLWQQAAVVFILVGITS